MSEAMPGDIYTEYEGPELMYQEDLEVRTEPFEPDVPEEPKVKAEENWGRVNAEEAQAHRDAIVEPPKTVSVSYLFPTADKVPGWFVRNLLYSLAKDVGGPQYINMNVIVQEGSIDIDLHRNAVCKAFLLTDREWLLFFDYDMLWNTDELFKFIEKASVKKPIVSGLYVQLDYAKGCTRPIATDPWGEPMDFTPEVKDAYVPVGLCPAGALLIHRSVLERMKEEFGEEWFTRTNHDQTEDTAFCLRAHRVGYPIYIDTAFRLGHIKPQVFWP